MIDFVFKEQIFVQDDVTTRLHHLAAHLEQIQSLWTQASSQELMLALVKESRYFIEWVVPVATCNYKSPNLQSSLFSARIICNYNFS
jgi:hypothetical protein